jgi:hypothetical protein
LMCDEWFQYGCRDDESRESKVELFVANVTDM